MIKFLELALSQEVYEYFEELDEMNWSALGLGNVLDQYMRNTSIGTTVIQSWKLLDQLLSFQLKCSSNIDSIHYLRLTNSFHQVPRDIHTLPVKEPIPSI